MERVLVTGGTGYVASWIIKLLLDKGIAVNTTVRDLKNEEKYAHLKSLAEQVGGDLQFFEADLLKRHSFDDAIIGCNGLIHTASPFFITDISNAQKQLIEPAQKGTANVLAAVNLEPKLKKVVLTSSVAAVYGDNIDFLKDSNGHFTEDDWNNTSSITHQPYSYSKTLAEIKAWELYKSQSQWDLAVINPGFILGPSLSKRSDSTSISTIIDMGNGTYKMGVPQLYYGVVDVRDVAEAHVNAVLNDEANGRHILVADVKSFFEIAQILRNKYGDSFPFPKRELPKWLAWIFGPFQGLSRSFVSKNVGIFIKFDNSKSQRQLGINYRPFEITLHEQFEQLLQFGHLKKPFES